MLEEIQETAQFRQDAGQTQLLPLAHPAARGAQRAVALLFLVNGATVGSWVPHIPERAHVLGLNAAGLGTMLLAGGIGGLFAIPMSGGLIRHFGSRKIAVISGILFPVLLGAAILLPSVATTALALFLAGLNASTMDVSMNAHGVLVEKLLGRRTVSLFHAIFSLGCFAGAGVHSFLMARHVPNPLLVPIFDAVLVGIVLWAAMRLLPAALEREDIDSARAGEQKRGPLAMLPTFPPHPRLLLLGMLCFSTMVTEGAMGDWSALFLRVVHHLPNGTAGYGYTCFAAWMVCGRLGGDRIAHRFGEQRTLRVGGVLSALGLVLVLIAHPFPLVLLGLTMAGLGLANASPILYRSAATMPGFSAGEGLATAVSVGYAGLLIGPPLLGLLGHSAGLPSIFEVMVALSCILAIGAGLTSGRKPARAVA